MVNKAFTSPDSFICSSSMVEMMKVTVETKTIVKEKNAQNLRWSNYQWKSAITKTMTFVMIHKNMNIKERTKSLTDLAVWLVHGYSITFHIHVRHFPEQWWHHHHLKQSWPISYKRNMKDLPRQWEPKSSSSASCISFFWHSMSPSFSFWHTCVFLEGAPQ